jgi:tRNA 2-thiouridine synthesizing protein E
MKAESRTDSERFDKEGFLRKLGGWTPRIATEIADSSPSMRPLVKYIRLKLGEEKGKSIYLLSQFPGSPAKIGSKIAGLPKPDNCL